jgi:hypothetical protein
MLLKLKGYGGKNLANENLPLTNPSHSFKYVSDMKPEELQLVETK